MAKSINDAIKMEITAPAECVKEFNFTIAADAVKSESAKVLNYIASMVQIPGFRAGKAPIGMVKSKYADSVEEELRNRIVSGAVAKIEDEKDTEILTLNFKSAPDFKLDGSADITFTFEANVMPEITVGDYNAIKVEVALDAVEESAIDERLDLYRSMYGSYAEVDGPAAAEDMLKASYTSDFVPAEDATAAVKRQAAAEDTFLWLSEPETIPGLIAALTGAEKGKEYTFAATYAADYREEALAGKTVNYTVKVSAIQRRTKLTDAELVEKFQGESIEKMRELIRNERRIELCFENKRFWDMRRWKLDLTETAKGMKIDQTGGALQYTVIDVEPRSYADHMYYGPIPETEVLKWSNLDQNKGW